MNGTRLNAIPFERERQEPATDFSCSNTRSRMRAISRNKYRVYSAAPLERVLLDFARLLSTGYLAELLTRGSLLIANAGGRSIPPRNSRGAKMKTSTDRSSLEIGDLTSDGENTRRRPNRDFINTAAVELQMQTEIRKIICVYARVRKFNRTPDYI